MGLKYWGKKGGKGTPEEKKKKEKKYRRDKWAPVNILD